MVYTREELKEKIRRSYERIYAYEDEIEAEKEEIKEYELLSKRLEEESPEA